MTKERSFPFQHELTKKINFYPQEPHHFEANYLEIGPGRGDLFFYLCEKNLGKKIICVEYEKKRVHKIKNNIQKREITNGLLIDGDARIVIPSYFKENTFERIYVLFPDPWPKDRHSYKRLLNIKFLHLISHLLKPGGLFIHATDVESYSKWVRSNLSEINSLKNTLDDEYVDSIDEIPTTFFESKWRDMGKKIFYIKYQKTL